MIVGWSKVGRGVAALAMTLVAAPRASAAEPGVLVIELDGGAVGLGLDDAVLGTTPIEQMVGGFAPYGDDPERREALLQAVRADWAAYDVDVTTSRPEQGDYAMVMVGPTNPFGPDVLGIATLDCDDGSSARSLAFAFYRADDGVPAAVVATTVSQEAAHGLGLEHVNAPGDIMLPVQSSGDSSFTDQCQPIDGVAECPEQHARECGASDRQNAHAELLRRFGPRVPDTQPPDATLLEPGDGDVFTEEEIVSITVDANDDRGLGEATLYIDGAASSIDPDAPYGWEIAELPVGVYEIYVVVADLGGNHGMSEVVEIEVVRGSGQSPPDDGESPPAVGGLPAPPPAPAPTSGCRVAAVRAGAQAGWSGLGLLLGLGALVRRRSACGARR